MSSTRLPDQTHISFIHLQTTDLQRQLAFYRDLLGFKILMGDGATVSLAAAENAPTLILLTERSDAISRPRRSTGLFHVAILFPSRKELARAFRRLYEAQWPFQGFADHGVSEALYLADPDGNGIELYADRPREQWSIANGELQMITAELDLDNLLSELNHDSRPWDGVAADTVIGHMHLMVSDLGKAEQFYHATLGFDIIQRSYAGALFVSAGGYHHHIGLNVWESRGAPPSPKEAVGMLRYGIHIPDSTALVDVRKRLEQSGSFIDGEGLSHDGLPFITHDLDGIEIQIT